MAILNPYLNFRGTTRDAMTFYQSVLGGELVIHTFGDMGATDNPDGVMHASLVSPSGFTVFASDGQDFTPGNQITISLSGPKAEESELRGYWDALNDGATVHVELAPQMWGDTFGQLVDKFGIQWMVNIGQE